MSAPGNTPPIWPAFCRQWRQIGRALVRRAQLIKRYSLNLAPDQPAEQFIDGLRIVGAPIGWTPKSGTPGKRSACPTISPASPCQYVLCKFATPGIILGKEQPGRRAAGRSLPPDFILVRGSGCALAVVEAHPAGASCTRISRVMALSSARRCEQLIVIAVSKIRSAGVDLEDPPIKRATNHEH